MADQNSAQTDWDAVTAERTDATAPATPQQPVVEVAPAVAAPADPYEGLSPDVRAKLERFDQMAVSQSALVQELRETKGRVSALQSDFAKSRQAQPAGDAPNQKQIAAAAKDPDKWVSLKSDFPEWGAGIEAFVEARVGGMPRGLTPEQVEQQIAHAVGTQTSALAGQFERTLIELKYEDWDTLVKTNEFNNWFIAQTPQVQALANSPKGKDAIRMLDMFHDAKKQPVANVRAARQEKLAAAVTAKPGAVVATKTFDDMTGTEQWNYLAEERERKARSLA